MRDSVNEDREDAEYYDTIELLDFPYIVICDIYTLSRRVYAYKFMRQKPIEEPKEEIIYVPDSIKIEKVDSIGL